MKSMTPQASAAHRAIAGAIARGELVRPDVCEKCSKIPKKALHGHHRDYALPLDVEWLCVSCHHKEHGRKERYESVGLSLPESLVRQIDILRCLMPEIPTRQAVIRKAIDEYMCKKEARA